MRKIETLPGQFQFKVGTEQRLVDYSTKRLSTVYVAQLPHSCDEWVIADDVDPAAAVASMERFVEEAQSALDRLREVAAGSSPADTDPSDHLAEETTP